MGGGSWLLSTIGARLRRWLVRKERGRLGSTLFWQVMRLIDGAGRKGVCWLPEINVVYAVQ